ncbi:MAG: hypothetical protein GY757_06810, partial [bacterium]|nr:hypothetical protein [bacterium]
KLKELAQVKSRFFANISHEFRTPLTLIMGPLENKMTVTEDVREKREMRVMLRNAQRLLTLINQMLDLSKLDSGKMRLRAESRNIVSLLAGVVGEFEMLARRNRLELTFQAEKEEITCYFGLAAGGQGCGIPSK